MVKVPLFLYSLDIVTSILDCLPDLNLRKTMERPAVRLSETFSQSFSVETVHSSKSFIWKNNKMRCNQKLSIIGLSLEASPRIISMVLLEAEVQSKEELILTPELS